MVVTIVLVVLAWYLFKYKAGYHGGQVAEHERPDLSKRSGDLQANEDLGTVGVTTSRTDGSGLDNGKPTVGHAASGGQPRAKSNGKEPILERPGPMSALSRPHERLSDLEEGRRAHLDSAEWN